MNLPEITVLTAVRNGAAHIAETIRSIQEQTFTSWEYIIVDDGSDDATVEIVERFMGRDGRLRLIRRCSSGGPYIAANEGLRQARGELIVRTDADDLSPPCRLRKQYDFLKTNRQYRACVSFWQGFNDRGLIRGSVTPVPVRPDVFRWYLLLRSPSIHSSACYQRAAIEQLGGYRELPLSQDYRLWCELSRRKWLAVIPEVLSYVRLHENRNSLTRNSLQRSLALDALSDHLLALTGEKWPPEDIEALWIMGLSLPMPVEKGLEVLGRWDRLWQAEPGLSQEDHRELRRLSAFRRWKHLRANARRQPGRVLLNLIRFGATRPNVLFAGLGVPASPAANAD